MYKMVTLRMLIILWMLQLCDGGKWWRRTRIQTEGKWWRKRTRIQTESGEWPPASDTEIVSGDNIALHKPTNQTSTYMYRTSDLAVDGVLDTDGSAESAPCARIQNDDIRSPAKWWVDLEDDYIVHTITIHNSMKPNFHRRMANFTIGVITNNRTEIACGHHVRPVVPQGGSVTFTCPPDAVGQYVHFRRVGGPDIYRVTICEVEVTGTLIYDELPEEKCMDNCACYWFSPTLTDFYTAYDECYNEGGMLFLYENHATREWIWHNLFNHTSNGRYWVGITDDYDPDVLRYVDGRIVSWTRWANDSSPYHRNISVTVDIEDGLMYNETLSMNGSLFGRICERKLECEILPSMENLNTSVNAGPYVCGDVVTLHCELGFLFPNYTSSMNITCDPHLNDETEWHPQTDGCTLTSNSVVTAAIETETSGVSTGSSSATTSLEASKETDRGLLTTNKLEVVTEETTSSSLTSMRQREATVGTVSSLIATTRQEASEGTTSSLVATTKQDITEVTTSSIVATTTQEESKGTSSLVATTKEDTAEVTTSSLVATTKDTAEVTTSNLVAISGREEATEGTTRSSVKTTTNDSNCTVPGGIQHCDITMERVGDDIHILFQCHRGYLLADGTGLRKRVPCRPNETTMITQWTLSLSDIVCVAVQCPVIAPILKNAKDKHINTSLSGNASYECVKGYHVTDHPGVTNFSVTCVLEESGLSAFWDIDRRALMCEADPLHDTNTRTLVRQCQQPKSGPGVEVLAPSLYVGSVANVRMKDGSANGGGRHRTIICQDNNQWSSEVDKIKPPGCGQLPNVVGGRSDTKSTSIGTKAKVVCQENGAKMETGLSFAFSTCLENGKWTPLPFSCKKARCGPFPYVPHTRLVSALHDHGGQALVQCDSDYHFSGGEDSQQYTCLETSQWETPAQCYLDTCSPLSVSPHTVVSTLSARVTTVVRAACSPGYILADGTTHTHVTCLSSREWDNTVPNCVEVKCPPLPVLGKGDQIGSGNTINTNITIRCHDGHRLDNGQQDMTVICTSRAVWSEQYTSCADDRCPPVPHVDHASASSDNATQGSQIVYTCDVGHLFSNKQKTMTTVCDGNNWNITETACQVVTCPFPNIPHATTPDERQTTYGSVVPITCHKGYLYKGHKVYNVQCTANSEWNETLTACEVVQCQPPRDVIGAMFTPPSTLEYMTTVTFTCVEGYWFQRGMFSVDTICMADGSWSEKDLEDCREITCVPVPVWEDVIVNSTNNKYKSAVNITYVESSMSQKSIVHVCLSTGTWEPDINEVKETSLIYTSPPTEAKGSDKIGVIMMSVFGLIIAAIVITDIPQLVATCRGK